MATLRERTECEVLFADDGPAGWTPIEVPEPPGGVGPILINPTPVAPSNPDQDKIDKRRVYRNVYNRCMARKKEERASNRATAILATAGVGCVSTGATGAFYGASGGGLVGFVFGGVGSAPGGALGAGLGAILGCGVGASLGILGQITAGDYARNRYSGNAEDECRKEASDAIK